MDLNFGVVKKQFSNAVFGLFATLILFVLFIWLIFEVMMGIVNPQAITNAKGLALIYIIFGAAGAFTCIALYLVDVFKNSSKKGKSV